MRNPVNGKITGKFGMRIHPITGVKKMHGGVDIAAPSGTPIVAPGDGIVQAVWNDTTYGGGLSIKIKHTAGFVTGYCHLSAQLVKVGQVVKEGDIIAKVGSTGGSTGPHLHFTVRNPQGVAIDPQTLFNF